MSVPGAKPAGKPLHQLATCSTLDVSSSRRIAVGSNLGEVRTHDTATGGSATLADFPGKGIWSVVFAPDGKTLAVGNGFPGTTIYGPPNAELLVYDADTRKLAAPPIRVGEQRAYAYRFSRDGATLYEKRRDEQTLDYIALRLWDATTGKNLGRDLLGEPDTTDLAVTMDDTLVLQSDRRGRVTRRSIKDGRVIGDPWQIHSLGIDRITVGPDGHSFATSATDGTVQLWDIETGHPLGPPIEHDSLIPGAIALSCDGRTLATSSEDRVTRFWDGRTGIPLGTPQLRASNYIYSLHFFPDGDRLAVSLDPGIVELMPTPRELAVEGSRVQQWAEARAGWTIDASGTVARLSAREWARGRDEFSRMNPVDDPRRPDPSRERDRHLAIALSCRLERDWYAALWHLDRALDGAPAEPAHWLERASAHTQLKHVGRALEDLERALALDPCRPAEWAAILKTACALPQSERVMEFATKALARWKRAGIPLLGADHRDVLELASRCGCIQRWDLAVALLRELFSRAVPDIDAYPGDLDALVQEYAVALLHRGELYEYSAVCRTLFGLVRTDKTGGKKDGLLWPCLYAPDSVGDLHALVRLLQGELDSRPEGPSRAEMLRILGAAHYRTGRFEECISRITESIRMRQGRSGQSDWAFLAMAHARKGDHAEALLWLNRLLVYQPPDGPDRFWEEQRMIIHRKEAAAVILYDPIFPADPFAH
jgi:tetratricopeptide (TPR) repeat protein